LVKEETLFWFEMRLGQAQPHVFMLSFDWKGRQGASSSSSSSSSMIAPSSPLEEMNLAADKFKFYQLFNYLKAQIGNKFRRI
jgi:hypothetical protein